MTQLEMQWDQAQRESLPGEGQFAVAIRKTGTIADPARWFRAHTEQIITTLHTAGALLLRGFELDTPERFHAAVEHIIPGSLNYRGGTSPRSEIHEGVYNSTDYPHQYEIALHNEMSYSAKVPDFIFFACATAPNDRGQTPIADCRKVLQRLPAHIVTQFAERGLLYERNMFGAESPYNSWAKAFETKDRELVERHCRQADIDYEWQQNGHLRTRERRAPVCVHPVTGERVWFNQATLWHFSNSPLAASLMGKSVSGLPMNVFFGDGEPLDLATLDVIRNAYACEKRCFAWESGDMLLLDNRLVAHGRMPFSGPRKIMVAMRSAAAATHN